MSEERDVAKDLGSAARRKEEAFALEHRNAHATGVAFDGDGCFLPGLGVARRCFHCGVLVVNEDVCKRCDYDGLPAPKRAQAQPVAPPDMGVLLANLLNDLQKRVGTWAEKNFPCPEPGRAALRCTLGVGEEAGELMHSILKREQGIRGTAHEHAVAARDAVGDICVYLMDLCHREGWYFGAILQEVSAKVLKRDWTKDKLAGGERQGAVESGGCAEAPFQPPSQPSRISER